LKNIDFALSKMKTNSKLLGNKAAADLFFTEIGVGINAIVFHPKASLNYIENELKDKLDFTKGIVVRFSKGNEINMPIAVDIKTVEEVINFINHKRKNGFATIVCPTFDIKNAFEVYFENETIFISVLPGKWDVTNNEPTDLIKIEAGVVQFFCYNKPRKMKLEEVSIKDPFSFQELENIAQFVYSNKQILVNLKELYNPLFIRGWQDKEDKFCFANCRESESNFEIHVPAGQVVKVSCEKDVEEILDSDVQVLFEACALSRENDLILYQLAEKIKNKGITSVLCNSALSHQAIILREAGLNTVQIMKENDYLLKTKKVDE